MASTTTSSPAMGKPTRLGVKFSPPTLVMEVSSGDDGKLSIHKYKLDSLFAREELGDDDAKIAKRLIKSIAKRVPAELVSVEQLTRLVARARHGFQQAAQQLNAKNAAERKSAFRANVAKETDLVKRLSEGEARVGKALKELRGQIPAKQATDAPTPPEPPAESEATAAPKDEKRGNEIEEASAKAVDRSEDKGNIVKEEEAEECGEIEDEVDDEDYADSSFDDDDGDDNDDSTDGASADSMAAAEKQRDVDKRKRIFDAFDASFENESDDEEVLVRNEVRKIDISNKAKDNDDSSDDGNDYEEDYEDEDFSDGDLNAVSPGELAKAKEEMDVDFEKNRVKKGDPGYAYDVRQDFEPDESDNSWDNDA